MCDSICYITVLFDESGCDFIKGFSALYRVGWLFMFIMVCLLLDLLVLPYVILIDYFFSEGWMVFPIIYVLI